MLYVFMVNTGSMLTFDMSLTMESVQNLSVALEREHQIHRDKQVLMISGGQSLDPKMRVGSYCAGTDTNPIFLFSKEAIEAAVPPSSQGTDEGDKLQLQVEGLKSMPPSMNAVVSRTQLALQFHDIAKEKVQVCEQLVHDQHLQQQGWMAVVANLEDITNAFRQRSEHFRMNMTEFLAERPELQSRLSQFNDTLVLLGKIPLLPKLAATADREMSLMQWISNQDQRNTLVQMGHQCQKAVDQFTDQILEGLDKECEKCLDAAEKAGMKEIKGLGERLFGLGQLVANAKDILTNQAEMAQGLVQNQTRVTNINDTSVLPDLCASHQHQLDVMLQKHLQLLEICRMCRVAKDELCKNLHVRLRWVMYIEQQISGTHGKMVVYHENLKRLRKRLEIVRQVVTAPELYAHSLVEIIRRRAYDQQYIQWAGTVSTQSKQVHSDEVRRRRHIAGQLERHFLSSLFPGMDYLPPAFITSDLTPYQQQLPPVSEDDITTLSQTVPELDGLLQLRSEVYYTTESDAAKDVSSLRLQESETQTTLPHLDHQELPARDDGVTTATEGGGNEEDDDDDVDIYTADDEPDAQKQTVVSKDGAGLQENGEVQTLGNERDEGRLVSNESVLSSDADGPDQLRGIEFLSLKNSMDDLTLTSMTNANNEQTFYSAISTPIIEGAVPFLSTRQEDLQEDYGALEGKIDTLRRKLDAMEMTRSVLESEKTNLERISQESSAQADRLSRDYHQARERSSRQRQLLIHCHESVTLHADKIRTDLVDLRTEFLENRDNSLKMMGDNCDRLIVLFSSLMDSETQRLRGQMSEAESRHQRERDSLSGELDQSQETVRELAVELETSKLNIAERDSSIGRLEEERQRTVEERNKLRENLSAAEESCHKHSEELENFRTKLGQSENLLSQKDKEMEILRSDFESRLEIAGKDSEEKLERTTSALKMENEMEIQDMEEKLREKDCEIVEIQQKMKQDLEKGLERIENEKVEALASLRREIEREEGERGAADLKEMQVRHVEEFEELEKCRHLQMEEACSQLREELRLENEGTMQELRETLTRESSNKILTLQAENESEVLRLKTSYEERIQELEAELADSKRYEATPVDLSTEVMVESIETKGRFPDLETLEGVKQQHAAEMAELRELLEQQSRHAVETTRREFELKMDRIRQSMKPADMSKLSSAEKQVAFNEAISRITAEKDVEIGRLKEREGVLLEEQRGLYDKLEKMLTKDANVGSEAQELIKRSREAERTAKYRLSEMEGTVKKLKEDLAEIRSGSPAELMVTSDDSSIEPADPSNKLQALLHTKEQECISLKKQLQMHMRNAHMGSKNEKVSIKEIGVGDLVWVRFEEVHQNYVVFTLEGTLYFVHSESVRSLGLRGEEDTKKRDFTLGRVIDKEYCQARKAQNRFRVPLGTKFYRVKVTSYDYKPSQPNQPMTL